MSTNQEFIEFVVENLISLGNVKAKRMFGGCGIFCDGLMFALVHDDILYLKVDNASQALYDASNLPYFSYSRKGKKIQLGYRRAPDDILDDSQKILEWSANALRAARAARK